MIKWQIIKKLFFSSEENKNWGPQGVQNPQFLLELTLIYHGEDCDARL